jgi:DNA mismatch repair protein MSH5
VDETIAPQTAPGESTGSGGVSCNAYDFMSRRREEAGDPTLKHWNASIRLSNFSCAENSPLCVSIIIPVNMRTSFD